MTKNSAITIAATSIFCMLTVISINGAAKVGGDSFGFTTDMTPVDIVLSNSTPEFWAEHNPGRAYPAPVKLRIPKAFMYFKDNWNGGYQQSIVLMIQPDLIPTALSDYPYKRFNISTQVTLRALDEGRFVYDKEILDFRRSYTPVHSANTAYDKYRTPSSIVRDPDQQDYVYIPKNANPADATYIRCNAYPTTPTCQMYDELGSAILLQLTVPNHQSEEWMNIRASVRKLISSFCVTQ